MTFDPDTARRARMSSESVRDAVNKIITEEHIELPIDAEDRKRAIARLILRVLYARYSEVRADDAKAEGTP